VPRGPGCRRCWPCTTRAACSRPGTASGTAGSRIAAAWRLLIMLQGLRAATKRIRIPIGVGGTRHLHRAAEWDAAASRRSDAGRAGAGSNHVVWSWTMPMGREPVDC
jgi:hypothetical protein